MRKLALAWMCCLALSLASGSSAAGGVTILKDIEYAAPGGVSQKLDAYLPPGSGPFPAVIAIHGGGWHAGDKSAWAQESVRLATAGFATFSINYRLAPTYPWPAQIEDVQAAVIWLRGHAATYRVRQDRIGAIGSSAGAHLAQMLAVRGSGSTNTGSRVRVAVSWSGPSDMVELATSDDPEIVSALTDLFGSLGNTEAETDASPLHFLDPTDPPIYHCHSLGEFVPFEQATFLRTGLIGQGVPQMETVLPGTRHAKAYEPDVWLQSVDFLRLYLVVRPATGPGGTE
jgi:dipeptidyl aminopeptidase/acylaminoacyl peptidase